MAKKAMTSEIEKQVQKALDKLDKLEATFAANRDQLNVVLHAIRVTKERVLAQQKLLKTVDLSSVPDVQRMIRGLTENLISFVEELFGPRTISDHPKRVVKDKKTPQVRKRRSVEVSSQPKSRDEPVRVEKAVKVKKEKRYGMLPTTVKIFKAAFTGDRIPEILENVLPSVFGDAWPQYVYVGMVSGRHGVVKRPLSEDLASKDSMLKRAILTGYQNLVRYSRGEKTATPELIQLHDLIIEKQVSLETVGRALREMWKIPV